MFDLTIQDFNGEPRMRDIEIARALGFNRLRDIRQLIDRCFDELTGYGEVVCGAAPRTAAGGRPGTERWLNEHQAFYICTQSKAKRAVEVTRQIINLFVAWRNGRIPARPEISVDFQVTPDTPTHLALVREVRLTKGIAAARAIYDRLPLPRVASEPPAPELLDGPWTISLFLQDRCVISGDAKIWIRGRDLYRGYLEFCAEGAGVPLGKRRFSNRLRAVAEVYRCPSSGGRFWPAKRSDTGFCGLRLIARA